MKTFALVAVLALVACGDDPSLEITSPADQATITSRDPIVVALSGQDLMDVRSAEIRVDGTPVPAAQITMNTATSNTCDECAFELHWTAASVPDGDHVIKVLIEYDLSELAADQITLKFARP